MGLKDFPEESSSRNQCIVTATKSLYLIYTVAVADINF